MAKWGPNYSRLSRTAFLTATEQYAQLTRDSVLLITFKIKFKSKEQYKFMGPWLLPLLVSPQKARLVKTGKGRSKMPSRFGYCNYLAGQKFRWTTHCSLTDDRGRKFSKARQSARELGKVLLGEVLRSEEINWIWDVLNEAFQSDSMSEGHTYPTPGIASQELFLEWSSQNSLFSLKQKSKTEN